jgi:hypothetical protein
MKKFGAKVCGVFLLFTVATCFGQTSRFEMPSQGVPLPATKFEIVNRIPNSHLSHLPKTLPIFRYSAKPREFSIAALQGLMDQSTFAGTNVADLFHGQESIRLTTARDRDYFIVDPARSRIASQNGSHEINLRQETPPRDGVPTFETVSNNLLHYVVLFGASTNDMERNADGSIHIRRTEDTITRLGGAMKFVDNRSARVSRSIAGHTFWSATDKVELKLGINGRLLDFQMDWRIIEAVRTNRVFTATEILDEIKKGEVLADVTNEYPDDGIAKITLKDIRIDYFTAIPSNFQSVSTNADIYPIASLYVTFKSKSGKTTEGGLFAPIIEQK